MKFSVTALRKLVLKEMQAVPKIPSRPEFGAMDIKDAIIEDAIDDYHSSRMSKTEVVSDLAEKYSMSVKEILSILAADGRWDMLAESKYLTSKRKLRQIIKEEKSKLTEELDRSAGIFNSDFIYDLLVDEVEDYLRRSAADPALGSGLTRTELDKMREALMSAFENIREDYS